jgi:hypothetical protein
LRSVLESGPTIIGQMQRSGVNSFCLEATLPPQSPRSYCPEKLVCTAIVIWPVRRSTVSFGQSPPSPRCKRRHRGKERYAIPMFVIPENSGAPKLLAI